MQKINKHLSAVIFFFVLTAIFMGPAIINPAKNLYGNPGVPYAAVWWGWWSKYSNTNGLDYLRPSLQGAPFGADYTHYPFQQMFWLYKKLFIFLDEITAYNLIIFIGFFASALSAYILAYFITKEVKASIFAGVIFSFNPFHLMQSTKHLWLATTQWIPVYFLMLFLLFIETFHGGRNKPYIPLLCAASFVLVLFENYYYGYMIFVLTILLFLIHMVKIAWQHRLREIKIRPFVFFCFFCFILTLPFLIPIWNNFHAAKQGIITSEDYIRSTRELDMHGAKWFDYFIPPSAHPLWGQTIQERIYNKTNGDNPGEKILFIGIVPSFLSGYAIFQSWKNKMKDPLKQKIVFFFLVVIFLAFILSFQEYLVIAGIRFPLASHFLYQVFPMFRVYARFGIFVMLGISILAALGIKELLARGQHWHFLMPVLVFFIIFEFVNFPPYPITRTDEVPQIYRWLREQPGEHIIVEYPLAEWDTFTHYKYLFWQRYHQKPILNGVRPGTAGYKEFKKVQLFNQESTEIMAKLGVKFAIIHQENFDYKKPGETLDRTFKTVNHQESFKKINGLKLVKTFDTDLVYEIYDAKK